MANELKDVALNPDALASLMAKLDEVMAEAARLRDEVSRQLAHHRRAQQQQLTPPSRRKKRSRKR